MAIKETKTIFEAIKQYHEEIIKPKVSETNDKINTLEDNLTNNLNDIENALINSDQQLNMAISEEMSARAIADNNLDIRLEEEIATRITRDIELTNYVNSEFLKTANTTATNLRTEIDREAADRFKDSAEIRSLITAEANLRIQSYDNLLNSLEKEVVDRKEADNSNLELIRSEFDEKLNTAISKEANRANEETKNLENSINISIVDLDSKLTQALNEEQAARSNSILEESNRSKIAEGDLCTKIDVEITRATTREEELLAKIVAEESTRKEAILGVISSLEAEVSAREESINTLSSSVTETFNKIDNNFKEVETSISGLTNKLDTTESELYNEISSNVSNLDTTITDFKTNVSNTTDNLNQRLDITNSNLIQVSEDLDKLTNITISSINSDITTINSNIIDIDSDITKLANNINAECVNRAAAITELDKKLEDTKDTLQSNIDIAQSNAETALKITKTHTNQLEVINTLIPINANGINNQLADKAYVEALIATESSVFVGTFNNEEEMRALENPKHNSYAFVETTKGYSRYKYSTLTSEWKFEYALNSTAFTEEQWAAINSNISTKVVEKITTNENNINRLESSIQEEIGNRESTNAALKAELKGLLGNHTGSTNNPHQITADQLGVAIFKDKSIDSIPEKDSTNCISSGAVYTVVETINANFNSHTKEMINPHGISADMLDLDAFANKSIEETAIKDSNNCISSGAVYNAMATVQESLTNHIARTENNINPHGLVKSDIGLSEVENRPMDSIPTEDSTNYVASGGVFNAITNTSNKLLTHEKAKNPHNISASTIGLEKVVNAHMDTSPVSNSNNYISSGAVYTVIEEVKNLMVTKTNDLNSTINNKLNISDLPTSLSDFSNEDTKYITIDGIPSNYITEEKLTAKNYLTSIPSEYITESELALKGYLTAHQDISGKVDKSALKSVAFSGSYNDLLDKPILQKGDKGDQGIQGIQGVPGKSAYEVWQEVGNSGTEQQFIESLKGMPGINGVNGATPRIGENRNWWIGAVDTGIRAEGVQGPQGIQGIQGIPGKDGYTPVKGIDYFDGQNGAQGPQGIQGIQGVQGEKGAKGDKGDKGDTGAKGDTGPSFLAGYTGKIGGTPEKGKITFILGTDTE